MSALSVATPRKHGTFILSGENDGTVRIWDNQKKTQADFAGPQLDERKFAEFLIRKSVVTNFSQPMWTKAS